MPMISRIGRRHPRVMGLIGLMYLALIVGGVTMIYPFLLMLGGSTKTAVDVRENRIVPSFLTSDLALYRKHVEALFNEQLDVMKAVYDSDTPSFERLDVPEQVGERELATWRQYLADGDLPAAARTLGYIQAPVSRTTPRKLREFKRDLEQQYQGDIGAMNQDLGIDFPTWLSLYVLPENELSRHSAWVEGPWRQAFRAFQARQPDVVRFTFSVEGYFKHGFLKPQYTRSIDEYNRAHDTAYASYDQVVLTETVPDGTGVERKDWEDFVRHGVGLSWVRLEPSATERYRDYLRAKYGSIERFQRAYHRTDSDFSTVPLPARAPREGLSRTDWEAFLVGWEDPDTGERFEPAVEDLRVSGPASMYRAWLAEHYGELEAVNRDWGTSYAAWRDIHPPHQADHYAHFLEAKREVRWGFVTSNYQAVWDYLVRHGRGVVNTVIYCTLAVLAALIVNPMAAYALSRFRLRRTYTILLILLLTMAFPPMVTQIPVFLMLRDFNLLNTFAALILPGLAHGYSIFLLKGFFDSLPRDLYESASIDGAGEWTMFWMLTMSLSKPILAVIALQAFTLAYSNFMYALLICQDERMWTMMVWLYQLQMRSGQGVIYASLIIAAMPTLVLFVFCQKIIMRGIVVPVEK